MATPQSPEFEKAIADSKKLTSKPGPTELLELYSLYKVGTGEDITKAPKLGMFDLKGKAKQGAWQKVVDEGLTAAEAQAKYVELVETLKVTYGYDANKEPEAVGN